jgi:hypothetical protein
MENYNIEDVIQSIRNRYIEEKLVNSYYDINNGLCTEFAEDVINLLGGETDELYGITNCNFTKDSNSHIYNWDERLLEDYWNISPPLDLSWDDLRNIYFGDHYWIVYNKRHYDAECPEGVDNFFNLPIFKRTILKYNKTKGEK